jgi:hypothetical protein
MDQKGLHYSLFPHLSPNRIAFFRQLQLNKPFQLKYIFNPLLAFNLNLVEKIDLNNGLLIGEDGATFSFLTTRSVLQ